MRGIPRIPLRDDAMLASSISPMPQIRYDLWRGKRNSNRGNAIHSLSGGAAFGRVRCRRLFRSASLERQDRGGAFRRTRDAGSAGRGNDQFAESAACILARVSRATRCAAACSCAGRLGSAATCSCTGSLGPAAACHHARCRCSAAAKCGVRARGERAFGRRRRRRLSRRRSGESPTTDLCGLHRVEHFAPRKLTVFS